MSNTSPTYPEPKLAGDIICLESMLNSLSDKARDSGHVRDTWSEGFQALDLEVSGRHFGRFQKVSWTYNWGGKGNGQK